MNIAYLILAHTDPEQLKRLVTALNNGTNSFFIHIDRRVDLNLFTTVLPPAKNIVYLAKRVRSPRCSFGTVVATHHLIDAALKSGFAFDYGVLLSGLDYPIKSNDEIARFFAQYSGREYLRYINILECPVLDHKVSRYYFPDLPPRLARIMARVVNGIMPRRNFLNDMIPYFGTQWWALTRDCLSFVMEHVRDHREIAQFYRYTPVPDEMFFHTIIVNSRFREHTNTRIVATKWDSLDKPVPEAGDHIKYVNWDSAREQPSVLDDRDFEPLRNSPLLFARKLTTNRSTGLMNRIDKELLQRERGV